MIVQRLIRDGVEMREVSFEGRVLGTYERNGYNDSDFYAIVWDGAKVRHIEYASTRYPSYGDSASVDASPEVRTLAYEYVQGRLLVFLKNRAIDRAFNVLEPGNMVQVNRGRKIPRGTQGKVYRTWRDNWNKDQIAIQNDKGVVFVAAANCDVVEAAVPNDTDLVNEVSQAHKDSLLRMFV
jgi:hypothetical protein